MTFPPSALPDPDTLQTLFAPEDASGILWWIGTLGCGGAERQVIATGREFARRKIPVALACQRLLAHLGDTHYLEQALELFTVVYDFRPFSQERSRLRKWRKKIKRVLVDAWKVNAGSVFFHPEHLRTLARKLFLGEGCALATTPGVKAREAARGAALPFRELFSSKEYAAFEHLIACFVELKPALLHVWSAEGLYAPVAAVVAGVPRVIISAQSTSPWQRAAAGAPTVDVDLAHTLLCWLLQREGVVLTANSQVAVHEFCQWLEIGKERVSVTPNLFETEQWPNASPEKIATLRQHLGIPEKTQVIGGLGRLVPVKDPELWIETVGRVLQQKKDIYAVLGGDGEMLEHCRRLAANTPGGDRIIVPGLIREVRDFYGLLSIFLLTSRVEGLPNVLIEAQYAGVPVVSTDAGGAAEAVRQGESGWIVPERDAEKLAEAVLCILNAPERALAAGRAARSHIEQSFAPQRVFEKLLAAYNSSEGPTA